MSASEPSAHKAHSAAACTARAADSDDYRLRLTRDFLNEHGELVSGASLHKLLGFRSAGGFRNSNRLGRLPVPVFKLPARRGYFAMTRDVVDWLCTQRFKARNEEIQPMT